jgi:vacuolar-type H+-ATPase subunit F/Vma7
MNNIHVLPTDKPSRLIKSKINDTIVLEPINVTNDTRFWEYLNIYITSDEEIKEGDWVLGDYPDNPICKVIAKYGQEFTAQSLNGDKYGLAEYDSKKIILTTDQDLIKDGVQAIDDEFLEWFVKNPSCEKVGVINTFDYNKKHFVEHSGYKIIIPKEGPKQEPGKETADYIDRHIVEALVEVAKQKMYSQEEVEDLIYKVCGTVARLQGIALNGNHIDTAYKKFKKK